MGWTGILYWLLARRLHSSWPLLAITSFGILSAVTLMAVGAIYSRALADGGVRHSLATADPAVLDAQVIIQNRPLGLPNYNKVRTDAELILEDRVGFITRSVERSGRTQPDWTLAFSPRGNPPFQGAPVGRPFFLTGFQEHSQLVAGRWPQAPPSHDDSGLRLETVLGARAAASFRVGVGTQVSLFPFRSDPSERIVLTIVGLAEPIDRQEEYWLNQPVYFSVQELGEQILVPFYVTERDFFDGLGAEYPSSVGDFGWLLFFDTLRVTAANAAFTKASVIDLEIDVNKRFPRTLVFTGLANTLTDYQKQLTLARVPIYLFLGLVVILVLYFLALVMGLLTRYRAQEASLLRSRGASIRQVWGLLVAAEGAVALIAVAVGPFLALAIVRYLLLDTINPVGVDDAGLSVGLSPDMFVMGAVGGMLSLAVLAGSGLSRARHQNAGSLNERARPPSVPFLHRYYVDLVVLAGLGLLWWQISSREGFVSRDLASRALDVDPSLLFGPVMVLLAAAVLVLRLLPLFIRFMAWAMARFTPPWAAFSLVRMARDPLPHGSLVIILMMAAALGVFGASFQSTLARNQKEQTLYRHGGDLVLRGRNFSPQDQEAAASAPGVETASPLARDSVVLMEDFLGASATLIRVEPDTLPRVAWFREDFAGKSLEELLEPLRSNSRPGLGVTPGISIPPGAESIGVWANVTEVQRGVAQQSLNLWARVRRDGGRFNNLLLGDLLNPSQPKSRVLKEDPQELRPRSTSSAGSDAGGSDEDGSDGGWIFLEAPLPDTGPQREPQFTLVSFFISKLSVSAVPSGAISLDDLTVRGPNFLTEGTVIDGYERPLGWLPLDSSTEEPDTIEYLPEAARTGNLGLRYTWRGPLTAAPRGIFLPSGPYPLPAIGSGQFQSGQVVRFRTGKQVVSVSIRDVSEFFPTVSPSSRPFLLVDQETYREHINRMFQTELELPREVWVSPEQDVDRQRVIFSLKDEVPGFVSVRDRTASTEVAGRNPLAGGGWNGLTALAISAITMAVLLTLGIHGVVAVRTGRVDLTVARALGFSKIQVFLSLALERAMVAALGIGVGSGIGVWLGIWVLGFLDITPGGQPVIPPMIIDVQGWLVGLVLACLAAATLASVALAALWANKLRLPEVLRTGE